MSDIDTALVDSLKALDPKRPIREADLTDENREVTFQPQLPQLKALNRTRRLRSITVIWVVRAFARENAHRQRRRLVG